MSGVSNNKIAFNQALSRSPHLCLRLFFRLLELLTPNVGEVTPASPLAQGVSRVSQSDLSG